MNESIISWIGLLLILVAGFMIGYGTCLLRRDLKEDRHED